MLRKLFLTLLVVILTLMLDINDVETMPKPFGRLHDFDEIRRFNLPKTSSVKNDPSEATTQVSSPTIPPLSPVGQPLSRRDRFKITSEPPAAIEEQPRVNEFDVAGETLHKTDFDAKTLPATLQGFLMIEHVEPGADDARKLFPTPVPNPGQPDREIGAGMTSHTNKDDLRWKGSANLRDSSDPAASYPTRRFGNHDAEGDFKSVASIVEIDFLDRLRYSLSTKGCKPLSRTTVLILLVCLGLVLFLFVFTCCIHWYCN